MRGRRLPRDAWIDEHGAVNRPLRPVSSPEWPRSRRVAGRVRSAWLRTRSSHPDRLHWWIRLGGWTAAGALLAIVSRRPWAALGGPAGFEAGWLAFEMRRRARLGGPLSRR